MGPLFLSFLQEEIFGSAYASAVYLSQILKFPKDKKVFVIGEAGLEEELRSEGINYCGGSVSSMSSFVSPLLVVSNGFRFGFEFVQDPKENVFLPSLDFGSLVFEDNVGAVLCGFVPSSSLSLSVCSRRPLCPLQGFG